MSKLSSEAPTLLRKSGWIIFPHHCSSQRSVSLRALSESCTASVSTSKCTIPSTLLNIYSEVLQNPRDTNTHSTEKGPENGTNKHFFAFRVNKQFDLSRINIPFFTAFCVHPHWAKMVNRASVQTVCWPIHGTDLPLSPSEGSFRERTACRSLCRAKLARSLPGNKAGAVGHWLMTANRVPLKPRPQCFTALNTHTRDWSAVGANKDSCLHTHIQAKITGQSWKGLESN